MAATESICVIVVLAPAPRTVWEQALSLPKGCTVAQAWSHAPWVHSHPSAAPGQPWSASVWGRKVDGATVLLEGDRVEWLRPLKVDPKVARRERFKGQGMRSAGLFSRRKPSP